MSKAVMQQALEALEDIFGKNKVDVGAITALRAALAEPEPVGINGLTEAETAASASVKGLVCKVEQKKKPVAWIDGRGFIARQADSFPRGTTVSPLYAHPPNPRKPLTDEEIDDLTMAVRNAHPLIVTPFDVWCRHFSSTVIAAYEAKQGE